MKRAVALLPVLLAIPILAFAQSLGGASGAGGATSLPRGQAQRSGAPNLGASDALKAKAQAATPIPKLRKDDSSAADEAPSPLDSPDSLQDRALLAMTTPEYPVTPGDIYALSFVTANGPVTFSIIVGTDYKVDLANIGVINGSGLPFLQLRASVQQRILAAYPLSSPQLVIQSCGAFPVYTAGEVKQAGIVYCWGLSRLSSLWDGVTPYASNRAIAVRGRDGRVGTYDLFKVWRSGDLSQDPYLKPFDTVTFGRYDRSVSVQGQVRRPGVYQLLPGEGLKELIEVYADGFAEKANPQRMSITRYVQDSVETRQGSMSLLDYSATQQFALVNADLLNVPSATDLRPVAYFEGALGVGIDGQAPQAADRIIYPFAPGEMLSNAVRNLAAQFSAVSDMKSSYILRGDQQLPVDIAKLLYGKNYEGDISLNAGDIVVVPFRQFFVTVSGAVKVPGRYPYVPDREWSYYVGLAGGLDESKNARQKLKIYDVQGNAKAKSQIIEPEDSIVAAQNSFLYYFGQVAPIITSIVSVGTLIVALN